MIRPSCIVNLCQTKLFLRKQINKINKNHQCPRSPHWKCCAWFSSDEGKLDSRYKRFFHTVARFGIGCPRISKLHPLQLASKHEVQASFEDKPFSNNSSCLCFKTDLLCCLMTLFREGGGSTILCSYWEPKVIYSRQKWFCSKWPQNLRQLCH